MNALLISLLLAVRVPTPLLSPASGSSGSSPFTVTVTSRAIGETVYCARDAQPKRSVSQRVALNAAGQASWQITESQTVNCRAWALDGREPSKIASAAYTVTTTPPVVSSWEALCSGQTGDPAYVEPTTNVVYFCSCDDPLAGEATTYPRDPNCVAGSDANSGLTKAAPKKTWSAAMSYFNASLQAGGTIAFCKGGRWNGVASGYADFNNPRCTAGQPCTLRDYAPTWGGSTRPILASTATGETWGLTIGNIGHAGIKGLRVLNLALWRPSSSATTALGAIAVRGFSDTYDVTFCNNVIDGWDLGVYAAGGSYWGDPVCNIGRWNWYGNRITNICQQGILYSVDDSLWDGNVFDYIGHGKCSPYVWGTLTGFTQGECTGANVSWVTDHCEGYRREGSYADQRFQSGGTLHTSYLDSRPCSAHRETFRNNEYYRNSPYLYGWKTIFDANGNYSSGPNYAGQCPAEGCPQGSAISVGVYAYDVLYENNYVEYAPAHPEMGMAVFMGGGGYGPVTLRGNYVKLGGGRFATFDSMSTVLIENNIIWASKAGESSLVYVPQGRGSASAATIRNNTLYIAGATSAMTGAIFAAANGSAAPTNVTGNSITFTNGTAGTCFRVGTPANITVFDYNQCSGASNWGIVDGYGAESLTTWRGRGWDAHSTNASATFVNAPTDLTPAAGSVLVGAASTATNCTVLGVAGQSCSAPTSLSSSTWSTTPVARTRDAAPDIGAIERPTSWASKCASEPEPTTSIIYVCDCQTGAESGCVPGNDSNAGTSKTAPKRSWTAVQQAWRGLTAGGTVALCKGGRWAADTNDLGTYATWRNLNCTAGQPCTLRDYGASWGGTGRPQIAHTVSDAPFTFWPADGTEGGHYRVLNLRIFRPDAGLTLTSKGTVGVRAANRAVDIELCNNEIDGFGIGIYPGTLNVGIASACTTSGWKIRGNRILNSCVHGFYGNLSSSDIDGNYWDNNGHATCGSTVSPPGGGGAAYWPLCSQSGGTTHTVYMNGEDACAMNDVNFINNEIHRNAMTDVAGWCDPSSPVFTGVFYTQAASALKFITGGNNVRVENNLIDAYPSHPILAYAAISATDQGSQNATFTNMVVRGNRVVGGGPHTTIQLHDAATLLVENNTVDMTSLSGADDRKLGETSIQVDFGSVHTPSRAVIRNNTVYIAGPVSTIENPAGVGVGANVAAGTVITGNAVIYATDNTNSNGACYRVDDPTKVAFMDNNQCSGVPRWANTQFNRRTLTDWRTYINGLNLGRTFDANSLSAAATFVNAPTDLTPAPGDTTLAGHASTLSTCTVLGAANQPCTSPYAIDAPTWRAANGVDGSGNPVYTRKTRTGSPFDIGAMER